MDDCSEDEIAHHMRENGISGAGCGPHYEEGTADWSNAYDDLDSSYWEELRTEPLDADYFQESETSEPANLTEDSDQSVKPPSASKPTSAQFSAQALNKPARIEAIIRWLESSRAARKFREKEGFLVPQGPLVRFRDGTEIDVIRWLQMEGLVGQQIVCGFEIIYNPRGSKYGESFAFFKQIIEAPFYQPGKSQTHQVKVTIGPEDIPF